MTTLELENPAAPSDNHTALADLRGEDLIVGRTLNSPIYDQNGVLLLAAGATITSEFKKLLKSRAVSNVKIDQKDVSSVSLSLEQLAEACVDNSKFNFDTEITKRLDSIVDGGLLTVQNKGPALKDSVVFHGKKAYSLEQRDHLLLQHKASSESLDTMMKDVLKGGRVDGRAITGMVANYLTDLTSDADNLMNVAFETRGDAELADDSLKTAMYGMAIGVEMGLDAENISKLGLIGLVQNWGIIRVPRAIRHQNRPLTDIEFLEIKKHPIYTLEMLEKVSGFSSLIPLVAYQMHERMNGKGYPRGRSGNNIHLFARILQVADAYTAMTTSRSHRPPLMPYTAMTSLLKESQQKVFDPNVVRAFLQVLSLFPIGTLVSLSDGSVATVMRRNGMKYTQPIVRVIQDGRGSVLDPLDEDAILDLGDSSIQVVQAIPTPGKNELTEDPYVLRNAL
ncbi:MAG: HD domain-containing phosphohydrolase [Planctomycetales bacterium]